jgi:hypothetical protein
MGKEEIDNFSGAVSQRSSEKVEQRLKPRHQLQGAGQEMEVVGKNPAFGTLEGGKNAPEHHARQFIDHSPEQVVQTAGDLVHAQAQEGCAAEGFQSVCGNRSEVHVGLLGSLCVYDEPERQKSTGQALFFLVREPEAQGFRICFMRKD